MIFNARQKYKQIRIYYIFKAIINQDVTAC